MNQAVNPYLQLLGNCTGVLKRAGEALQLALAGIPPIDDVAQLSYVRQQAQSVASVALDVHLLLSHERYQNVVGLCRIAFESRIHAYAAMRVPDFAAQKYLAQAKANVDEAEELVRRGVHSPEFTGELEAQRRLLANMRRDFGGISERKWKISEAADVAGLKDDYAKHYSLLSKAAHNTPTGIASKDDPRILVSSVLRLLYDTSETCACLVFFRQDDNTSPQPLTANWADLLAQVTNLTSEYGRMVTRLSALFEKEF
jgi:hypothetical protein